MRAVWISRARSGSMTRWPWTLCDTDFFLLWPEVGVRWLRPAKAGVATNAAVKRTVWQARTKSMQENLVGGTCSRPFCEGKGDFSGLQAKPNRRLSTFEAPVPVWFAGYGNVPPSSVPPSFGCCGSTTLKTTSEPDLRPEMIELYSDLLCTGCLLTEVIIAPSRPEMPISSANEPGFTL